MPVAPDQGLSSALLAVDAALLVAVAAFVLFVAVREARWSRAAAAAAVGVVEHQDGEDVVERLESLVIEEGLATVALMPRDANSLFAALSHQLYGHQVGSERHSRSAARMRRQVAEHMLHHLGEYFESLHETAEERGTRYKRFSSPASKVAQHLTDLAKPGTPPGRECLRAAADHLLVNLAVYPPGRGVEYFPCRAEHLVTDVAALVRRSLALSGGHAVDLYDSVVSIDPRAGAS